MVCPACGLPNDPAATVCARCQAGLTAFTPPPRPTGPQYPGPPSPQYPGQPFPGAPLPPPKRRSALPWIAGAAVLVIVVALAGIAVVLTRGSGDPEPPVAAASPSAPATAPPDDPEPATTTPEPESGATVRDQLTVLDGVLDQSIRSRRKLNDAIDKVNRCAQLDRAVADMTAVGDERRDQIKAVTDAVLDQVPDGERLRGLLTTALQRALAADQGFLGWARPAQAAGGCGASAARTTAYNQGQAASKQAGSAKEAFLAVWNPLAGANGLAERSRDDI